MSTTPQQPSRPGFDLPLAPFLCLPDLPLADVLTLAHVEQACDRHHVAFGTAPNTLFTPALALWAWLSQTIGADKSCLAACVRVSVLLLALNRPKWSEDTGCYCRARTRLGSLVAQELALGVADRLEQAAPQYWRWKDRRAFLVDGSTITLADTKANQEAFPQPKSQKKGLGFPMIRLVMLLSLATGAVSGLAYGPYQGKQTGELALLVRLLDRLQHGDILVADRCYCAYVLLALLARRGIDTLVRLHSRRKCDFRKGQRLGHKDHLVTWKRPPRPEWLSEALYETLPKEMLFRELDVTLSQAGFQSERVVLVTTLLDAEAYPKAELAQLYKQRWLVEVDLRGLKQTMRIDHIEAKTPALVAGELWTHALGYNLTRKVMAQAALLTEQEEQPKQPRRRLGRRPSGLLPRDLSLKAALQQLREYWQSLSALAPSESAPQDRSEASSKQKEAALRLLAGLKRRRIGERPGRHEPRAIKKRPGNKPILSVPRAEAKKRLAKGPKSKQAQTISKRRRR